MKYRDHPIVKQDMETIFNHCLEIDRLRGKSILVTGARGMIGSFLIDFFIFCNEVKSFHLNLYAAGRDKEKLAKQFDELVNMPYLHLLSYDLNKEIDWDFSVDYILHLAGESYPKLFMRHPAVNVLESVNGCYHLLTYASKHLVSRFLYVSSGEVYGQAIEGMEMFTEEYQGYINGLDSRSCYPVGKRAAETVCISFMEEHDMDLAIVRPCHIYGPTATTEDNRIIFHCMEALERDEDIILNSSGNQRRSYCYIADCVSAMLTVLLKGQNKEVYNIASPISKTTIKNLADTIASFGDKAVIVKLANDHETKWDNPMNMAVLSSNKLEKLGWKSYYSLWKGLEHTITIRKDCKVYSAEK